MVFFSSVLFPSFSSFFLSYFHHFFESPSSTLSFTLHFSPDSLVPLEFISCAGFRNPAYMVDKDAETGERSSTENRLSTANDATKTDAGSTSSGGGVVTSSAPKAASTKLNTDAINDLNLLGMRFIKRLISCRFSSGFFFVSLSLAHEPRVLLKPILLCI